MHYAAVRDFTVFITHAHFFTNIGEIDRLFKDLQSIFVYVCLSVCLPCHETGLTVEITGSATASIAFDILQNFMAEIHPYLKERKKKQKNKS